jgi:NDP-sugar pyrophosphorylase family protein
MRAVILAGGKGTRLRPYTTVFPKPLMPLDDMPILEIVIRQLKRAGLKRVTLAVGHLAELIEAFFGDGSKWGIQIDYSREDMPLGTMGGLTLIDGLEGDFFVMNGDLLCDIDFRTLVNCHKEKKALFTIAVYNRQVKIDFGVLDYDADGKLVKFVEKPTSDYRVSMGIYVMNAEVLRFIPKGEAFGFDDLMHTLISRGEDVYCYPFDGYWLDIGRADDYEKANEEFNTMKTALLGE